MNKAPRGGTSRTRATTRTLTQPSTTLVPTEGNLRGLNDCGCCDGLTTRTPVEMTNRPGLSTISYRVGTYTQFKQSMLARLSAAFRLESCDPGMQNSDDATALSAIHGLKTRNDDDFSIALLDSWATVADVLTFYQERIANESYLRTAREQLSLLHLARQISYELRSGVAANTYLAFTIEDAPGTPGRATIDVGSKVQSLPNPGEQPQIFETIETIDDAYAEWNAMKPRMIQYQQHVLKPAAAQQNSATGNTTAPSNTSSGKGGSLAGSTPSPTTGTSDTSSTQSSNRVLFLNGLAIGLKAGDGLLIVSKAGGNPPSIFCQVVSVTPQPKQKWTKVELQDVPYKQAAPARGTLASSLTAPAAPVGQLQALVNALPQTPLSPLLQWIIRLLPQGSSMKIPPSVPEKLPETVLAALDQTIVQMLPETALASLPPVTLALLQPHLPSLGALSSAAAGVSDATKQVLINSLVNGATAMNVKANGASSGGGGGQSNGASPDGTYMERTISSVDLHALAQLQNFEAQEVIDNIKANTPENTTVFAFRIRASIFGNNAPRFDALSTSQRVGDVIPDPDQIAKIPPPLKFVPGPFNKLNLDDSTWVDKLTLDTYPTSEPVLDPDLPAPKPPAAYLYLDNAYPSIVKDSLVVLRDSDSPDGPTVWPYWVTESTEISKSDFTLTAKVSRLKVDDNAGLTGFKVRETTVFAQSEELKLASVPLVDPKTGQPTVDPIAGRPLVDPTTGELQADPIQGQQIDIEGWIDHLYKGQKVVVCGELQGNSGNSACEATTIIKVDYIYLPADGAHFTRITLASALNNAYINKTVTINANIALATHGDTVQSEVLGSGDASQTYQSFTLRNAPLTYITAPTASGAKSTLKVYVNNVEWHEVPALHGHGPRERIFVTRSDDNGKTIVQFGDGRTGARLPTGHENVRATYRKGSGPQGTVKAGQLSLLMTRPLGVKSVTNPMGAAGADAGEVGDDARRNASLTVQIMGRLVSLQDYEEFARAYVGIAKALASRLWFDQASSVFITVAIPGGDAIKDDAPLLNGLLVVMQSMSAPYVALRIKSYRRALFRMAARVKVDPIYPAGEVLKAVLQALQAHFSFDGRSLAQPVLLSEIIATMQDATGVIAVEVYRLYHYSTGDPSGALPPPDAAFSPDFPPPPQRLDAALPHVNIDGSVSAAELLMLDVAHLEIWE